MSRGGGGWEVVFVLHCNGVLGGRVGTERSGGRRMNEATFLAIHYQILADAFFFFNWPSSHCVADPRGEGDNDNCCKASLVH